MPSKTTHVPNAEQFRRWLEEVLGVLKMRPSPFATGAGVPVNAARKFLKGEQRDLRLDTASLMFSFAHKTATARKIKLPDLEFGMAHCGAGVIVEEEQRAR